MVFRRCRSLIRHTVLLKQAHFKAVPWFLLSCFSWGCGSSGSLWSYGPHLSSILNGLHQYKAFRKTRSQLHFLTDSELRALVPSASRSPIKFKSECWINQSQILISSFFSWNRDAIELRTDKDTWTILCKHDKLYINNLYKQASTYMYIQSWHAAMWTYI